MSLTVLPVADYLEVYAVYVNTDLNEGRGPIIPLYFCRSRYTAIRLSKGRDVQDSDGEIRTVKLPILPDGTIYAPLAFSSIQTPTPEDQAAEARDQAQVRAIAATEKALSLGLTEQDIADLLSAR